MLNAEIFDCGVYYSGQKWPLFLNLVCLLSSYLVVKRSLDYFEYRFYFQNSSYHVYFMAVKFAQKDCEISKAKSIAHRVCLLVRANLISREYLSLERHNFIHFKESKFATTKEA